MNKQTISFTLLGLLLSFASYKAGALSLDQLLNPGACPSIGPVPACYLVFGSFFLALIAHLSHFGRFDRFRHALKLFFVGLGFPTALAIFASIGEIGGFVQCPQTDGGIPMCYLSLALCVLCWILWKVGYKRAS